MEQKALIVIPVYNEENNLPALLQLLKDRKGEVLLVNDGSTDYSGEIIRTSGFSFLTFAKNRGIAAVYRESFKFGFQHKYTQFVTLDSDGQHDPAYIDYFISQLNTCKLVIGNRFTTIDSIPESKIASNFFAVMLTRLIFGIELPDVACGFRACDLKSVANRQYRSFQFGIVYELLFYHLSEKLPIVYVPVPATYPPLSIYATKRIELECLLDAAHLFSNHQGINDLIQKVKNSKDFRVELFGYLFEAILVEPHGYVFSTNINKAEKYYRSLLNNTVYNY